MAEYIIQDSTLTNIGNAIRNKVGISGVIPTASMASYIRNISTYSSASYIGMNLNNPSQTSVVSEYTISDYYGGAGTVSNNQQYVTGGLPPSGTVMYIIGGATSTTTQLPITDENYPVVLAWMTPMTFAAGSTASHNGWALVAMKDSSSGTIRIQLTFGEFRTTLQVTGSGQDPNTGTVIANFTVTTRYHGITGAKMIRSPVTLYTSLG